MMRGIGVAVALWLLVPVFGSAQDGSTARPGTILQPGDVVRIGVWRSAELSGEFTIAADGSITHPLYRELRIAGLPMQTVERQLEAFLARFGSNPQFVVEPLLRVAVGGEVRQPNLFTLSPETTLAQAVALAGGATERGRLHRVRLMRDGREAYVDLLSASGGMAHEPVRSGDQIFVTRSRSIFRDYIAPAGSVTAAAAAIVNIILTRR